MADIVDCVRYHRSRWFSGPYGFVLANPELVRPVATPGQVGLFTVRLPLAPLGRLEVFPKEPVEEQG